MDQTNATLNTLISACKMLSDLKEEHSNIKKGSKQNFNFFYALVGKTHLEKYHSNFIWYLLDPKESHDCETLFLRYFVKMLKIKISSVKNFSGLFSVSDNLENEDFELNKANVNGEVVIGNGRIDIEITQDSKEWLIYIENKIRSPEGNNQMLDYFLHYNKLFYKKKLGIYLTPHGDTPKSIADNDNAKKEIISLSYKDDIIYWLKSCCADEELIRYPHIISALIQYMDILKKELNITNAMESEEYKEYLIKSVSKKDLALLIKNIEGVCFSMNNIIKEKRFVLQGKIIKYLMEILKSDKIKNFSDIEYIVYEKKFMIRVWQGFPNYDDQGKGLWWGVYAFDERGYQCGLEEDGYWQSVQLGETKDFYETNEGSIKIMESDETVLDNLANEAAKDIVWNLKNKAKLI